MITFMALNNFEVVAKTDEAFDFILAVANAEGDLESYARWISDHLVPVES
jgi:prophage maintenance system killer protein